MPSADRKAKARPGLAAWLQMQRPHFRSQCQARVLDVDLLRCLPARQAASGGSHLLLSPGSRALRLLCLALLVLLGTTGGAVAQEASKELWPEVDLWLRLSPSWRLSMFVPISHNIDTEAPEQVIGATYSVPPRSIVILESGT